MIPFCWSFAWRFVLWQSLMHYIVAFFTKYRNDITDITTIVINVLITILAVFITSRRMFTKGMFKHYKITIKENS
jgi:hypothetical protein